MAYDSVHFVACRVQKSRSGIDNRALSLDQVAWPQPWCGRRSAFLLLIRPRHP